MTTFEGFHIYHYKEVLSTNTEALNLIAQGITDETIIIADKQTRGKGRTGKNWISPEGNFYASLVIDLSHNCYLNEGQTVNSGVIPVLDPSVGYLDDRLGINKLTEFTFIAALAVGNTLMSLINDLNIQYKWPNDVLIDGKKISGILLEKRSSSNWLVIGIGINITSAPLSGTTCIGDYGAPMSNMDLLKELIINFNNIRKKWLFYGFNVIREMWLKRAFKLNEQISIKLAEKSYEGIFTNIDKCGKLVLQQKDNDLIYFDAGELFINSTL